MARCDRCLDVVGQANLTMVGSMAICPPCLTVEKMAAPWWRFGAEATCIEGFVIVDLPRLALDYFRASDRYVRTNANVR